MGIWVDTKRRQVIIDWYGRKVKAGKVIFSEEADTWMFEAADGLRYCRAPEGRYTLSDEMDDGLYEKIDDEVTDNQGAWFAVNPTELFFGAEPAPDYQTYDCPHCGTELVESGKIPSGHTHQCPKCETLHAPYGRDE